MPRRSLRNNDSENPVSPKRRKIEGHGMQNGSKSISTDKYTVGWICSINTELTAATAFLDEKFDAREYDLPDDNNDYTLGRIGRHYVVITVLPGYGTASAAAVARDMMRSFSNMRIRLLVGIGGGAPTSKHDIRLGDIVVSVPENGQSGVLHYDFGKTIQQQEFQITGVLNQPPKNLLAAVTGLRTNYESNGHQLENAIDEAFEKSTRLRKMYQRPSQSSDRLYKSDVIHPLNDDRSCLLACGDVASKVVSRTERSLGEAITIHYGLVASANQVMKDAITRDKLALQNEVLCFEMEAAGLMNDFSCLVIRGICDYSDSHKNKDWQGYAAMAAAAYAKDLLNRLRPIYLDPSRVTLETLENEHSVEEYGPLRADHFDVMLKSLSFEQIGARHLTVRNAHAKTCKWLLENQAYLDWLDPSKLESHHGFLWIKGKAGIGKSTLMKFALTNAQKKMIDKRIISFYFNARGGDLEKCTTGMYRSLLLQLFEKLPKLQSIMDSFPLAAIREDYIWTIQQLKSLFEEAIRNIEDDGVVCFIDALDECDEDEIRDMVSFFQNVGEFTTANNIQFHVCFSSRHYPNISKKN
jgi:nucleoside phosphorylase